MSMAAFTDTINRQETDNTVSIGKPAQTKEAVPNLQVLDREEETEILEQESTWKIWGFKLLFTVISLKAWGLVASMAVTTYLLVHRAQSIQALVDKGCTPEMLENISIGINGAQWITFNVTIWTMLYGIKEVKKIADKPKEEKNENL